MTPTQGKPQIAGQVLPLQKAEELLSTLSSVVSAKILADESGGVDAIHVLVTGEFTPKQVVRNVESALVAQLGMRIDHRKISVATTVKKPVTGEMPVPVMQNAESKAEIKAPPEERLGRALYFEDVEVRGSRTKGMLCRVTLRRGTEHFVGESEGFESERGRVELAARAAMAAIQLSEGIGKQYALEGTKMIHAFDRDVVVAGVSVRHGRSSTLLTGSCPVRDSAETASVLAVLDATNRWVEGVKVR